MIKKGRVCIKTAGRDAGRVCIVIEEQENNFVLIDGETRRKKCNVKHLEPLKKVIDMKTGNHDEVKQLLKKEMNITVIDTKPKESKQKPRKIRKSTEEPTKKEKPKAEKKKVKKEKTPAKEKVPARETKKEDNSGAKTQS